MSKPSLYGSDSQLEKDICETLIAGLKEYRYDLSYPESHSDMYACIRGLLKMFEVKRRPIVKPLKLRCISCEGLGNFITQISPGIRRLDQCNTCQGKGYIEEDLPEI